MNAMDLHGIGRLLQWALRTHISPAQDQEYGALMARFVDEPEFREAVRQVAIGLGLDIIDFGAFGLILVPEEGSIFELHPNAFRGKQLEPDDRLIDGLIQIGIAAVVYPRPEDLDEDVNIVRREVTVPAVDQMIRDLCGELANAAKGAPLPAADDMEAGLAEAWRAYEARFPEKEGARRSSPRATLQMIRTALELMVSHGMFTRVRGKEDAYQPTRSYQIRIQMSAARDILGRLRRGLIQVESA